MVQKIPASGLESAGGSFKNLFINGDMQIAQRTTSSSGLTTSAFVLDRWQMTLSGAGTWTMSQDTDVPTAQGFTKSLKLDCTTADGSLAAGDYLYIHQRFEGQMLQHLKKGTANAEKLTVSFWVKNTKTGTHVVQLWDEDNDRIIATTYTVDTTNTWEHKVVTFAGDTTGAIDNDNAASFRFIFWFAAGSNYSSGTLSTSWESKTNANRAVGQVNSADSTSNNIYLTGLQVEIGDTASDFEHLPHDVQLQRCYRYFQKIQMASNTVINSMAYGSTAIYTGIPHPDGTMRTSPTVTLPTAGKTSGTVAFVTAVGAYPTTVGTNTVDNVTANYFRVIGASYSANFVAGYAVGFYSNGTNNILIDAEL
jgi:hypothetical protein